MLWSTAAVIPRTDGPHLTLAGCFACYASTADQLLAAVQLFVFACYGEPLHPALEADEPRLTAGFLGCFASYGSMR